jgi:hypothetical protein
MHDGNAHGAVVHLMIELHNAAALHQLIFLQRGAPVAAPIGTSPDS